MHQGSSLAVLNRYSKTTPYSVTIELLKYELMPLKSKDVYKYKTDMNQLRNKLVSVSSNHVFGSDVILSQK